jgi:hypothetical protein
MALLSGAQQVFGSIEIHNSIAKIGSLRTRFPSALFFSAYGGADVSLPWDPEPVLFLLPVSLHLLFEISSTRSRRPVAATEHWRRGPRRSAEMAPFPAAANKAERKLR